jgi:hypothetical protein
MDGGGFINFESSWKKAKDREALREARADALIRAEDKAAKVEARKSKEAEWMLPDLHKRLVERNEQKKKKKKKEKKERREKKKHKKEKKKRSKSSSSSDSEEEEWVEKAAPETAKVPAAAEPVRMQRDSWMELGAASDAFVFTFSRGADAESVRGAEKKRAEQREREAQRQQLALQRELNPNLRKATEATETKKPETAADEGGGASFLRRALQRAEEQAKVEGKTVEEIVAKRWGSMDTFRRLMKNAESRSGTSERRPRSKSPEPKKARERSRSRSPEKGKSRRRSRSRSRSSERDRRRRRSRSRSRSRSRDRKRDRRSRSRDKGDVRSRFARPREEDERGSERASRSPGSASTSSRGGWKTADRVAQERKAAAEIPQASRSRSDDEGSGEEERPRPDEKQEGSSSKPPEPVEILTDQEMNALGAKIIKAEMLGNEDLVRKLKDKMERAKAAKQSAAAGADSESTGKREETVVLTRTDAKGFERPIAGSAERSQGGRRKTEKVATHGSDGKRQRYFADDDRFDLKQMFEREKLSTAEDQNAMMNRLAGKAVEKTNDDYDIDDVFVTRATKKDKAADSREVDRAIAEHQRMRRTLDDCRLCLNGGEGSGQKHLMVALGETCYLALPPHTSLTEDHCFIVPVSHVACATNLDEDVQDEMNTFRKALVKMYAAEDRDCVFFESALNLKKFPHMILQCVPLEREYGDTAPMYFQKAIQVRYRTLTYDNCTTLKVLVALASGLIRYTIFMSVFTLCRNARRNGPTTRN